MKKPTPNDYGLTEKDIERAKQIKKHIKTFSLLISVIMYLCLLGHVTDSETSIETWEYVTLCLIMGFNFLFPSLFLFLVIYYLLKFIICSFSMSFQLYEKFTTELIRYENDLQGRPNQETQQEGDGTKHYNPYGGFVREESDTGTHQHAFEAVEMAYRKAEEERARAERERAERERAEEEARRKAHEEQESFKYNHREDANATSNLDWCYALLGIQRGSTLEEINHAYRRKAKKHHPDHSGDEDVMRMLNDAVRILRDSIASKSKQRSI